MAALAAGTIGEAATDMNGHAATGRVTPGRFTWARRRRGLKSPVYSRQRQFGRSECNVAWPADLRRAQQFACTAPNRMQITWGIGGPGQTISPGANLDMRSMPAGRGPWMARVSSNHRHADFQRLPRKFPMIPHAPDVDFSYTAAGRHLGIVILGH